MKSDTVICLFANKKYFYVLGTFITNLKDKFPHFDYIYIFHDDLDDSMIDIIKTLESNIRFIRYDINSFVNEFKFNKKDIINLQSIKIYTILTIVKFKIFNLLNDFIRVIYFDIDMLLLDDISEILSFNYNIAWRSDIDKLIAKLQYFNKDFKVQRNSIIFNIYSKALHPNGGFFIINDNFDYNKCLKDSFDYFCKYFLLHPFMIDEATFSYVVYKNKLQLLELNKDIYNVNPKCLTHESKLLHFYGPYKPWQKNHLEVGYNEWIKYYKKFLITTGIKPWEILTV